ncbi:MAG: glutamate-5-semialdehyde dehydrogenase [Chloroflexi bacterium]|nr:glutamate-5-semialdehyde dehydrogenase [Chloroflexota bacterium]
MVTEAHSGTLFDSDLLVNQAQEARSASRLLAHSSDAQRSQALYRLASLLREQVDELLQTNALDVESEREQGASASSLDRLALTASRVDAMATSAELVARLPDPLAEQGPFRRLSNGLWVGQRRVPFGVIGIIFEGRPNVTIDAASLCLKAGNAVLLRGSRSARKSNQALVDLIQRSLKDVGLPESCAQGISAESRETVAALLKLRGLVDLVIPRGGRHLIDFVVENAQVPVIETGAGVCHTYIDRSADPGKAEQIVVNAKVRRPSICNALDTVLIDRAVAQEYLPVVARALISHSVTLHCDEEAYACLIAHGLNLHHVEPALASDWGKEYLSLDAAVAVVDGIDGALEHIATFGSGHSEAIIAEHYPTAMRFLQEVDAAAVYLNASTQFTDGGEFGLGAEIGISTQKLHARGPMGLREITTYKWVILGDGQVRPR